jgi:hypothetical protein
MIDNRPLPERCAEPVHLASSDIMTHWDQWAASGIAEACSRYRDALTIYAAALMPGLNLTIELDNQRVGSALWSLVSITPGRIDFVLNSTLFVAAQVPLATALRLCSVMPIFAEIALKPGIATEFLISLEDCADADVGFSGSGSSLLIPDSDFMQTLGHSTFKHHVENAWLTWKSRRRRIFWRGSTTGIPRAPGTYDPDQEWFRILPRLEVCHRLRTGPYRDFCDVGISAVVQLTDAELSNRIRGELGAGTVERIRQIENRYLLDIDGNSNAWSGLFQALAMGACVIKIGSPHNYSQWYYDRLIPWTHYVPVRSDLADLEQKIDWGMDHVQEAEQIASNARKLALSMSFESEVKAAAEAIVERFKMTRRDAPSSVHPRAKDATSSRPRGEDPEGQLSSQIHTAPSRRNLRFFRAPAGLPRLQSLTIVEKTAHYRRFEGIKLGLPFHSPRHAEEQARLQDVRSAEYFYITHSVLRAGRDYVFLSLGAARGEWTVIAERAYHHIKPRGNFRSVSLEGDANEVGTLRKVHQAAGLDPQFNIIHHAVAAKMDGNAPFPIRRGIVVCDNGLPGFQETKAISVASLVEPFPRVDFLHCDIRTSELEALAAGLDSLQRKVAVCCIETHGMKVDMELRSIFWALGWEPLLLLSTDGYLHTKGYLIASNPKLMRW